jgi:hypothetical protein
MNIRTLFAAGALAALATLPAAPAHAAKPRPAPVYEDGNVLMMIVVSEHVVGVDHKGVDKSAAIPLYAFPDESGIPGPEHEIAPDVLSKAPGDAGYNPWWELYLVFTTDGRDVRVDPFTSEAAILAAQHAGKVVIVETDFLFLCQVIGGGK